jgi:hypothetical protein
MPRFGQTFSSGDPPREKQACRHLNPSAGGSSAGFRLRS